MRYVLTAVVTGASLTAQLVELNMHLQWSVRRHHASDISPHISNCGIECFPQSIVRCLFMSVLACTAVLVVENVQCLPV